MEVTVKCNNCKWEGSEKELVIKFNKVEMSNLEHCPECGDAWNLVDNEFQVIHETIISDLFDF